MDRVTAADQQKHASVVTIDSIGIFLLNMLPHFKLKIIYIWFQRHLYCLCYLYHLGTTLSQIITINNKIVLNNIIR